jgi:hypothetical protein
MHSVCSQVDGPRRCIGTDVSIELTTPMFGWLITHRKTARVSGSDSGNAPAPNCVKPRRVESPPVSGRQFVG